MDPGKCILVFAAILAIGIGTSQIAAQSPVGKQAQIARGKYLVDGVARCGECHSPMNDKGEPILGKEYRGATLIFKPIAPMPVWADKAPNIAGLRGWEDEEGKRHYRTELVANEMIVLGDRRTVEYSSDNEEDNQDESDYAF